MKKVVLSLLCALCATALFAQSPFVVSPLLDGDNLISFQGTSMSQNRTYACGKESMNEVPAIWNINTNQVISFVVTCNTFDGVVPQPGVFNAINNNGIAVGSLTNLEDYVEYPIMASVDGTITELYRTEEDAGGAAWGITEDGSIIVGFHFDESWITHPCIWTNNGQTRTDLPVPTTEQMGFAIDYASARWISADGNTILGYGQDFETGQWVATAWRKNGSEYQPLCFASDYFQSMNEEVTPGSNVFFEFEPTSISKNGEWAALRVVQPYDINDWSFMPQSLTARYNFNTGTLEVLNSTYDFAAMECFSIADDGTCAGRMSDVANNGQAFIWMPGQSEASLINDIFPDNDYLQQQEYTAFSSISADAHYVLGYAINTVGDMTTFLANLSEATLGIHDVENGSVTPAIKGTYDLMGRKVETIRNHGIYIIDGKKVIR